MKISKQLINNPDAIRYTIATFAPSQPPNFDTLFQGGSSAVDVFPGTKETFGGKINGYGESTPLGDGMTSDYTIYYLYNGINPIAEYAPNGSILARYIYAGGRHIAKVAGADTHWYHCDALGSPRKMTDERGSTVWSATYYPFGEMTAGSNNTHGFTGKEFDSEMGLNYFCQRYYDPEIGRFTTLDPQNSPTASPYAYCANCPLVFIDPTGETMWPRENPDYGAHGTNDTFCPFYGTSGFGSWPGSMASYMRANPGFFSLVANNNLSSIARYFAALELQNIVSQGIITSDDWEQFGQGVEVMEEDCRNAAVWLKENFSFLASLDYWLDGNIIDYIISEALKQSMIGKPKNEKLTKWDIWVRINQRDNTWSLRRGLAHEFSEIMWLRAHRWNRSMLIDFWREHGHYENPGHHFAIRWGNLHF